VGKISESQLNYKAKMAQYQNNFPSSSCSPSSQAGRGLGGGVERTWKTRTELWEKLKPLPGFLTSEKKMLGLAKFKMI
jgi:hypothetical protein